jgi:hypothetical protein
MTPLGLLAPRSMMFTGEVDRVYLDVEGPIHVRLVHGPMRMRAVTHMGQRRRLAPAWAQLPGVGPACMGTTASQVPGT